MKRAGFATILVLLITAAVSMSVISLWHAISILSDITTEQRRQMYLEHYTHQVLIYGVDAVRKHFGFMYQQCTKHTLSCDVSDGVERLGAQGAQARLTFIKHDNIHNKNNRQMSVISIVEQGDCRCTIRCIICHEKSHDVYSIDGYTFVTSL